MTENGWLSSAINSIIFLGNAFWFNAVLSKLLYFFKYLSHGRCRNTGRRQSFLAAPRNAACCSGCLFKWQIKLDVLKLLAVLDNSAEHSLQMVIFFFFGLYPRFWKRPRPQTFSRNTLFSAHGSCEWVIAHVIYIFSLLHVWQTIICTDFILFWEVFNYFDKRKNLDYATDMQLIAFMQLINKHSISADYRYADGFKLIKNR